MFNHWHPEGKGARGQILSNAFNNLEDEKLVNTFKKLHVCIFFTCKLCMYQSLCMVYLRSKFKKNSPFIL